MSKFFQALEQAERDRALQQGKAPPSGDTSASLALEGESGDPASLNESPTESAGSVDGHLVSLVAPAAFEAEQYRALRYRVEQLRKARDLRIVAVSSPGVGDGKTTTAINLAGALAQASDARVLLVDADLRRPSVTNLLALGGSEGPGLVTAILDPTVTLERAARSYPSFNLSVIPAGQAPPSPYEVLKSPRLGELLEEARRRYDYIVVDAPPLCPVQDCRVIAQWVDGFLLVVRAHRTPRRLVEEAFNVVDSSKMVGLVFNGDDQPLSGYYSGYYSDYSYTLGASPNGHGDAAWRRAVKRLGGALGRRGGGRSRTGPGRGNRR